MIALSRRNSFAGLCASIFAFGAASSDAEAQYKEKILYSFKGGSDGADPRTALIADAQGNIYGTTFSGGRGNNDGCAGAGCGTVFKLTPQGKETVLYAFTGGSDGAGPDGALIADAHGNLYGTAGFGGRGVCEVGCGTVFEVTPEGSESVIYSFTGLSDGSYPINGLIADAQGNFYGAALGGDYSVFGEVFKVTPQDKETVLYSFTGGTDGGDPNSGLISDAQGDVYGTGYIQGGCDISCNTVFEVTPQGTETVFHDFASRKGGTNPVGLIVDAKGNFFGTTEYGGGKELWRRRLRHGLQTGSGEQRNSTSCLRGRQGWCLSNGRIARGRGRHALRHDHMGRRVRWEWLRHGFRNNAEGQGDGALCFQGWCRQRQRPGSRADYRRTWQSVRYRGRREFRKRHRFRTPEEMTRRQAVHGVAGTLDEQGHSRRPAAVMAREMGRALGAASTLQQGLRAPALRCLSLRLWQLRDSISPVLPSGGSRRPTSKRKLSKTMANGAA